MKKILVMFLFFMVLLAPMVFAEENASSNLTEKLQEEIKGGFEDITDKIKEDLTNSSEDSLAEDSFNVSEFLNKEVDTDNKVIGTISTILFMGDDSTWFEFIIYIWLFVILILIIAELTNMFTPIKEAILYYGIAIIITELLAITTALSWIAGFAVGLVSSINFLSHPIATILVIVVLSIIILFLLKAFGGYAKRQERDERMQMKAARKAARRRLLDKRADLVRGG